MAKSKVGLRARVSQATGRQPKKPTNPVQRAFGDVRQLVSDTGDRFLSRSGKGKAATKQGKKTATTRKRGGQQQQAAAKKSAASSKRSGQQRQAAAKKSAASRIRGGQQRQAATKKATRTRGAKTS